MTDSNEDTVRAIIIHDDVCKEAGVSLKFCGLNSMATYACKRKGDGNGPSQYAPCESNIHVLNHDSILFEYELRKLVNESNGTFLKARNIGKKADLKNTVLKYSREHRSSIRQTIENLQAAAIRTDNEKYYEWADVFDNIETLWHLCELLHLDVVSVDAVLPRLVEWVQFHSSECDSRAAAVLTESHMRGAELRHSDYWELVWLLLVQGRFEATRALLKLHSDSDNPAFIEVDALLRSIPIFTVFCGLSISEFNGRWKSWKSAVRSKLKSEIFASEPQLQKMMTILGGEDIPIGELKPYCKTWYELMCCVLLFSDPTVKLSDINYHSSQCIAHYGGSSVLTLFDYTILSIFDSDILEMLRRLQMGVDGSWCAVHLGSLFDLIGYFNDASLYVNRKEVVSLELLFIDYGQLMMSHHSLWQVGATYLEHCPTQGSYLLEILLSRIPLDSEQKARVIINIAKRNKLDHVGHSVAKVMGMRYLKENHIGNALTWALKSNDSSFTNFLADHYLKNYALEGKLECADALKHLSQTSQISSRLAFLAKYCEFHEHYEQGDTKEAAGLLIRLLDSKVSPKYFWLTLLSDALPLLQASGPPVFSRDDTTVLLACLEEMCTDLGDSPTSKNANFIENVHIIRMAIARNLAKALVQEVTQPGLSLSEFPSAVIKG